MKVGSLVKFMAPAGKYFDTRNGNSLTTGDNTTKGAATMLWAQVVSVTGDGTGGGTGLLSTGFGPITLNVNIPTGAVITQIVPKWRTAIDTSTIALMIDLIFANKPFGLRYDITTQTWKIVFESNLNTTTLFSVNKQGDTSNQKQDASWLLLFTTDNQFYTIKSRQLRYVFESDNQVRFYFDKSQKIYDSRTNSIIKDNINLLSVNTQPDSTSPFTRDLKWDVISEYNGLDGYVDNKKILVTFADSDSDGVVDNPDLFTDIVSPDTNSLTKYIVLQRYNISLGQEDYKYVSNTQNVVKILNSETDVGGYLQYTDGQYFYFKDTDVVKKLDLVNADLVPTLDYKVFVGRDNLKFQYTHSADYESRIDPGTSNIIDVYLLTKNYDTSFRQWVSGALTSKPLPPSSDELHDTVASSLDLIKSISDEIVYHPVNYKVLFGSLANEDVQGTFKITKNPGQVISDNDVKAKAITAINEFFALENWDFGDTFYFTELSTYVMKQLSPNITNFVIVPKQTGLNFGSLFEIKSLSNEIFINGATVDDVEIITGITSSAIKSVTGTNTESTVAAQQNVTSSSFGASNG